jgi:alanine racemase
MRLSSELSIRLDHLGDNIKCIRDLAPHNEILLMVKANAYGHGVVDIVRYSFSELNIKEFGVATLSEALYLRQELPNLFFDVYVFSELHILESDYYRHYIDKRIIPVLTHQSELEFVLNTSALRGLPLCLKFNTGMNRLGFELDELEYVAKAVGDSGRPIHHLMTHMACASQSMKSHKKNAQQLDEFQKMKQILQNLGIKIEKTSVANSGMIEQGLGLEETHIRPGLIAYGPTSLIAPVRSRSLFKGKSVASLRTRVLHIFNVTRGQPIGYGAKPVPEKGLVAVIALGYGDGLTQAYQGATVSIAGEKGKIFGRVSMDMSYVLLAAQSKVNIGDEAIIWDETESLVSLSDQTKTSCYEIFCQITSRVPRHYHID